MAQLIKQDGTVEEFIGTGKAGKNGKPKITLEDAYHAIGCDMVELVALNNRKFMILDEEGKFNSDNTINRKATAL